MTAHVFFATDAEDEDVCLELLRVRPDGRAIRIAAGIQRLRYATDPRRDVPLAPDAVHEVVVDLWAGSRRLEAGDRFRVQISGSLWPWYARNLHTLEPPFSATRGVVATNRVHHGVGTPSRVVVPIRRTGSTPAPVPRSLTVRSPRAASARGPRVRTTRLREHRGRHAGSPSANLDDQVTASGAGSRTSSPHNSASRA